jgi:hypothetical protein
MATTTKAGACAPATLNGRIAKCLSCSREAASSDGLPFFQFNGEGSDQATKICVCGYSIVTHLEVNPATGRAGHNYKDHEFTPRGDTQDTFYCGCRGWE